MHDINRTQLEAGWETGLAEESEYEDFESEYEDFEAGFEDSEYDESEDEFDDSEYDEYEDEMYAEAYEEAESSYGEAEGPLDEAEEIELASELLEVSDEDELDQFIGKLIRRAKKGLRKLVPRGLRRRLRKVARKILPAAGAIAGNFFAPGIGGMVGRRLGSVGTKVLGLELEGLSPEDQEFEIARRYVRLVSDAAQEASMASPGAHPEAVAERAVMTAVKKHAPGLLARPNGQAARAKQQRQKRIPNTRGAGVRVIRMRPDEKQVKLVILRG